MNRRDKSSEGAWMYIISAAYLIFPSRGKLNRCLPNDRAEGDGNLSSVMTMACYIDEDGDGENTRPSLPLDPSLYALLPRANDLEGCLRVLAGWLYSLRGSNYPYQLLAWSAALHFSPHTLENTDRHPNRLGSYSSKIRLSGFWEGWLLVCNVNWRKFVALAQEWYNYCHSQ